MVEFVSGGRAMLAGVAGRCCGLYMGCERIFSVTGRIPLTLQQLCRPGRRVHRCGNV